jgi:hypothetical protein
MRTPPAAALAVFAVTAAAVLAAQSQQSPPVRLPSVTFGSAGEQPPPLPSSPRGRSDSFQPGQFPQGRGGRGFGQSGQLERPEAADLEPGQVPYDGRFVFARLRYTEGVSPDELGGGGMFRRRGGRGQGPPWSHDYPRAEHNFMKILQEITTLDPYTGPAGGAIVDIGSKELFNYTVSYMCEPGFWTQTDAEAANLRAYLLKGGFIIFDDFRGNDWTNFDVQMRRVLPDLRMVELDLAHPIFHSFFDIETLEFHQYYDRGTPQFIGAYLDNDPNKRLLFVANFNNDVGEYWEYSDTGWTPIDLSNEAYKLGVNYIIYGITH